VRVRTCVAPPGLVISSHFTRHFRAGLSHCAASRLDFRRDCSTVLDKIQFSMHTVKPALMLGA
jgi:hypothetical protein